MDGRDASPKQTWIQNPKGGMSSHRRWESRGGHLVSCTRYDPREGKRVHHGDHLEALRREDEFAMVAISNYT